ncbi:SRPBCC family protein [Nocardioides hwasunensis]|uniref:SRPBCC family protein n=1 Tax=Nocardioides hwasunensis TaxID=397258 RepID=A0ABR8MFE3_9ACTN|nr:SRPBCC family protein [Nocardioides hwasunensis]MBD3914802.1 SRPBCC family protein [Nocardioides hwasunensis]
MTENHRLIHATPDQVWDVISDGWLYPLWVVGAARMRDVDESWPDVGSKLHHSVGSWPLLLDDETEVVDATPGRSITLRARAWPAGEARVHLRLDASGVDTDVRIDEVPVSGPAALMPPPLHAPALKWRNSETLRRLAFVAENRS